MLIGTGNETRQERQRTASLEERTAEFTRLYEARAYLVYNLALRITCERKTALAAAEAAFLRQAEEGASEATLIPAVVTAANGQARRKPSPDGVGEPELPLLAAAAAIQAPERAALALTIMADLPVDETGAILSLGHDAAAELVQRATEGFAAAAGVEPGAVYDLYVEWGWADPPAELWERVYPDFRRAIDRAAEATAPAATAAAAPNTPRAPRRWRRKLIVAAVLAGLVGGGVVLATQGGGTSSPQDVQAAAPYDMSSPSSAAPAPSSLPEASSEGQTPTDPVAAVQSKPHKPLTPRELDELRLKELAALRNYQKRETDRRLSKAQRDYAARKVDQFRALARERAEVKIHARQVAARERALARAQRRLDAQRRRDAAKNTAQQPDPAPAPKESGAQNQQPPPTQSSDDGARSQDDVQQECVQDAESGAYICPE